MSKFVIKTITSVKGKQQFKQLIILDDSEDEKKLQLEINKEEEEEKIEIKKDGVLDIYENSLENKYKSSFLNILATMDRVSNLQTVSPKKFKDVTPRRELIKEYEFKDGDLRVYAIKIFNGELILFGGYKNQQKSDFTKFRSLKSKYLEFINKSNNEKR